MPLLMTPKSPLLLAPLEWRIMKCVWDLGAADPIEITKHLRTNYRTEDYNPKTIGVVLLRLLHKGYVQFTAQAAGRGRPRHVYTPLVTKASVLRMHFDRFLDDYLLDQEDIEALEAYLSERRRPRRIRRA